EEVYEDVKGETLSREDFVATMLATRSVKEVSMVLEVLDKEKAVLPAATTQSTAVDTEEENRSEFDGSMMSSTFSIIDTNTKAPRRRPMNTFRIPYEACNHDGPCSSTLSCKCLRNGTFCEKFCGCSEACKNRFVGCKCKKSGCITKTCPCFAASRVCDPDLCNTCGSYIPPTMRDAVEACCSTISHLAENFKLCQNIGFSGKNTKKLLIKPSKIHGWGLHVAEDIRKNDFIIEYVGEVITQEEAERRGLVYDKLDLSFLFKLNDMQCIDATRRGNKAKYINHSEKHANCVPKVVQVGGDHKVILLALRDIKLGEELFFDYLYAKTAKHTAPDWSKGKNAGKAMKKQAKEV
ncbi:SET domain-containing protein-lysine N-methyltransferase, partial [archaeon]